jgi:hypothetical protein
MADVCTIGNYAGVNIFTATAAEIAAAPGNIYDSGPLMFSPSGPPGVGNAVHFNKIQGHKEFTLQCIGTGTNIQIEAFFTLDQATAMGNGNEWIPIPSPSTEAANQWVNPMTPRTALRAQTNCCAIRFTAQATLAGSPTGSVSILIMAST